MAGHAAGLLTQVAGLASWEGPWPARCNSQKRIILVKANVSLAASFNPPRCIFLCSADARSIE